MSTGLSTSGYWKAIPMPWADTAGDKHDRNDESSDQVEFRTERDRCKSEFSGAVRPERAGVRHGHGYHFSPPVDIARHLSCPHRTGLLGGAVKAALGGTAADRTRFD